MTSKEKAHIYLCCLPHPNSCLLLRQHWHAVLLRGSHAQVATSIIHKHRDSHSPSMQRSKEVSIDLSCTGHVEYQATVLCKFFFFFFNFLWFKLSLFHQYPSTWHLNCADTSGWQSEVACGTSVIPESV